MNKLVLRMVFSVFLFFVVNSAIGNVMAQGDKKGVEEPPQQVAFYAVESATPDPNEGKIFFSIPLIDYGNGYIKPSKSGSPKDSIQSELVNIPGIDHIYLEAYGIRVSVIDPAQLENALQKALLVIKKERPQFNFIEGKIKNDTRPAEAFGDGHWATNPQCLNLVSDISVSDAFEYYSYQEIHVIDAGKTPSSVLKKLAAIQGLLEVTIAPRSTGSEIFLMKTALYDWPDILSQVDSIIIEATGNKPRLIQHCGKPGEQTNREKRYLPKFKVREEN